jgi:hypothetical protein
MNRVQGVWAGAGEACEAYETEEPATMREGAAAEVVEAVLSWMGRGDARDTRGGNVLGVKESRGGVIAIGEKGDLLVPAEVLGDERIEVVRFDGDHAMAVVPAGAKLRIDGWESPAREIEITRGHVVEIVVGSFVVRLSRVRAGSKIAGAPLEGLRRAGASILLGSALAHVAAFAVLAYVSPALGATEEDAYDQDRIALMTKMLNASAQVETERQPQDSTSTTTEGGSQASQQAERLEGQAGKDTPKQDGKWSARGTATPETATLARDRELSTAANWLVGVLPSMPNDPNAPTVPWGTTLNGADADSKIGHLYGGTIDDAMGLGGWGLTGVGEGGGGFGQSIGIGDSFGGLGGMGKCTGPGPCKGTGIGGGSDRLMGTYKHVFKGPRYGTPQANGHLPAEVIQRIVRQNDGRYRFCYEQALKANPNLEGRVTVKFLISRDGSVGFAADGGSDIPDVSVRQCVVSSFTQLSFPAPDSGVVTVLYPIVFNPQ